MNTRSFILSDLIAGLMTLKPMTKTQGSSPKDFTKKTSQTSEGAGFFTKKSSPPVLQLIPGGLCLTILIFLILGFAPMPLRLAVNHALRQCAQVLPGDECGDAVLPEGWEYLDPSLPEVCPAGYTTIERLPLTWTHFKAPHCCTEGHSGVSGDCADVVVELLAQKCAFVDDINLCAALPGGWTAWGKDCPAGFKWQDDIACELAQPSPTGLPPGPTLPTATPAITPLFTATSPPAPTPAPARRNPLLPCCGAGVGLLPLALVVRARKK